MFAYIRKNNNVFFFSLYKTTLLRKVLNVILIILFFAGPWFSFGRFVSYLFFALVVSLVRYVVWFRSSQWSRSFWSFRFVVLGVLVRASLELATR